MALPVDIVLENCHRTQGTDGLVPIDGGIQWDDPPGTLTDFTTFDELSGETIVEPLGPGNPNSAILNLGSKGNFACYLGSMIGQTTRRVHIPGVPLSGGERVTGTITTGSVTTTTFSAPDDGLAFFGSDRPKIEFGGTLLSTQREVSRDFNPLREVYELEGRNATYGVFYQWRCRFWPAVRRVGWTLTMSFTDERLSDRTIAWPLVKLVVPSTWQVHIDNAARCYGEASYVDGASRYYDLIAPHTIHDAQSARFRGTFLLPSATEDEVAEFGRMPGYRTGTPRILAQPEEFRGKLFFYEGLPARPKSRNEASCRDRYERFRDSVEDHSVGVNDYTRRPFDSENNPRARDGGSQPDFAAGPGYELFFRPEGNPLRLPELDAAGDRHMSRPITQRRRGLDEANTLNARIVKWGDYAARDFILQESYIFFRVISGTTDVRGKSLESPNNRARYYRGMTGLLRSHFSINHAIEAMMFGGCFDAEDIVRQHIELFLYEWIADDGVYHSRALQVRMARILDAMAWCWLITGDARIPNRFNELAKISATVWERYSTDRAASRPFLWEGLNNTNESVDFGDGRGVRTMRGTTADPWQTALCQGYYRAFQLTGTKFFEQITQDLTRTWIFTTIFTKWHDGSNRLRGPAFRPMFKLIYPGLNGNPGIYGEFPPVSWLTPDNERIFWRAFNDTLWMPHMLAISLKVHVNERATYDRALAIFAADFKPWLEATNVSIFDGRGEWQGDDALLPGYRDSGAIDVTFAPEAEELAEPGFTFDADQTVGLTFFVDPETQETVEPAFTFVAGDLTIDFAADVEETVEPGFVADFGDFVHVADPEIEEHVEAPFAVDFGSLDLTFASETEETVEPGFTALGGTVDLVFGPDIEELVEPGFVFENRNSTQGKPSATIKAYSGASRVDATSGATRIRAESTA